MLTPKQDINEVLISHLVHVLMNTLQDKWSNLQDTNIYSYIKKVQKSSKYTSAFTKYTRTRDLNICIHIKKSQRYTSLLALNTNQLTTGQACISPTYQNIRLFQKEPKSQFSFCTKYTPTHERQSR